MISRVSFLFALTTNPTDASKSIAHSGGWSEGHWQNGVVNADFGPIAELARARANLLPKQASIIGFRIALYDLVGNKLTPRGTSTGKFLFPGNSAWPCDLPQMALELSGVASGEPNISRMVLRGIPDQFAVQGEYAPSPAFSGNLTRYTNQLFLRSWGFVGRDLGQARVRLTSIQGAVVTLPAAGVFAVGDYMIFNRVKNDSGNSVSGSYLIKAAVDDTTFTLQGMGNNNTSIANGTVRKDVAKFFLFGDIQPSRAVVRKVGRPFESYRGRASKRT